MRPAVYIAITNHGFGHAVRAASVAAQIQKQNPEILLIFATKAPRWLLASYVGEDFIYRPRAFDVGVVQADALQMDREATLTAWQEIRRRQNQIIASEVDFLRLNRVGLILADIPPLVAPMAKAAGIPCWMMGNFGWDFIYRPWGGAFADLADWIGECFAQCDRLFRLPFHEPMSAFPHITDTGLTGGTPHYPAEVLRQAFNITAPVEKTVLLSFGGLGLQKIPYANLTQFPDWQFITFDPQAPQLPNLLSVSAQEIPDLPVLGGNEAKLLRPVDFMPLCARVVSKPGYSTFAEAMRLQVPVVSLQREGFAESPLLLQALRQHAYHQIVSPDEFMYGGWEFLRQPLSAPESAASVPTNGSEAIASQVVRYLLKVPPPSTVAREQRP
ncbi:glycosyl transferase [Geitlerinema sp. PCC 9228]|jgi:hypothetical protein|uniref:glycosyl transferase n=1 Tax=Geitlerinema sp. PCC 9228 TaxID=111611 RepID=UPI0008F99EFF|nr:glycosyl transferase [Geitlerinema sp. PCC 9228]